MDHLLLLLFVSLDIYIFKILIFQSADFVWQLPFLVVKLLGECICLVSLN